jgi:hypothetical protein
MSRVGRCSSPTSRPGKEKQDSRYRGIYQDVLPYIVSPHRPSAGKRSCAHRPTRNRCVPMTTSPARTKTHQCIRCTGKTTFLAFILAWLISTKQVVLLYLSTELFLFYHGKVHVRRNPSLSDLPRNVQGLPTWMLIDVDSEENGPSLNKTYKIWPIHASSPDPKQWKRWTKQFGAPVLGMPLWNIEELTKGYIIICFLPGHVVWQGKFIANLVL